MQAYTTFRWSAFLLRACSTMETLLAASPLADFTYTRARHICSYNALKLSYEATSTTLISLRSSYSSSSRASVFCFDSCFIRSTKLEPVNSMLSFPGNSHWTFQHYELTRHIDICRLQNRFSNNAV